MHNFSLTTSYFPAQSDAKILDITIGDLLREFRFNHPDPSAMVTAKRIAEFIWNRVGHTTSRFVTITS